MSKYLVFLFPVLLFACNDSKEVKPEIVINSLDLVWSDDFDTDGLPDSTKWSYDVGNGCPNLCGWGNNELEYYSEAVLKNSRVENGHLIIEAHKEDIGSMNYTSARLVTKHKGDWKYGRIEVKAKLPRGKGTWPAIWMLPTDMGFYGGWPQCGEIDIMEHVGYSPDSLFGTIHTEAYNHMIGTQKGGNLKDMTMESEFHVYALDWNEDSMSWYMDNKRYFEFENENASYKEWPFDQKFHLIMNIAVGGNWGGKHGVDEEIWPQQMVVDYVRVYQNNSDQAKPTSTVATSAPSDSGIKNLFNGKDLTGWHMDIPEMDSVPDARIPFIVRNGNLVSLGTPQGHLITDEQFENYRLEVKYRFAGDPGNCGVLVHASTPRSLYKMFPKSIEVQMYHENAGDFWCIVEDIKVPRMAARRGPPEDWGIVEGKKRRILNLTDGTENPIGEWNEMRIECIDDKLKVWLNGKFVNYGYESTATKGQIAVQAEGAEVEFAYLKLTPISKLSD